jgi:hypothetical protein
MSKSRIEQAFEKWSADKWDSDGRYDGSCIPSENINSFLAELLPSDDEIDRIAHGTYLDLKFINVSEAEASAHKISWSKGAKWLRSALLQDNQTEET